MESKGRERSIERRLMARWQRKEFGPLTYKRLEGHFEETGEYREGVRQDMREYKERLVAERMSDVRFKRDLQAARERLKEARQGKEATWRSLQPFLDQRGGMEAPAFPVLWRKHVEASDTYSAEKRRVLDRLRATHKLNWGWLFWLDEYLRTGENKPDKLKLYHQTVKTDTYGGRYIRTDIHFPLSRRMLDEMAYWTEFSEAEAFGTYYQQRAAGGRPPGRSEKTRQKLLELAQDYYDTQQEYQRVDESPLTEREFCEARGISVASLQRALREHREVHQKAK